MYIPTANLNHSLFKFGMYDSLTHWTIVNPPHVMTI